MSKIEVKKRILQIEGMDCTNCALGLKKQLGKIGVDQVDVVFATGEVFYDSHGKDDDLLVKQKIQDMGYQVVAGLENDEAPVKKDFFTIGRKFWFSLFFTIPLLLAMFIPLNFLHNPWFQLTLTLPVFAVGLWHFGRSAIRSLRAGIPNMDVLIILGSTAAFVYSLTGAILNLGHDYMFFETTATIITLILLGNYLEHKAVKRTTNSIDSLVQLQKTMTRRVTVEKGMEVITEIDALKVKKGDILLVNMGEKIPVDGEILDGGCSVDESMISGESIPVEKLHGQQLIGGTVMISGNVRMRATAIGQETVLSQIIDLVKKAQQDKPPIQSLADKISAVFVPVVVGIALLTFAISFWFVGIGLQPALLNSIAVLVIACPCALGLAIPTAVVVGVGRVARNGILIKGASTIQKMLDVKYIAFDKTGTLTNGDFKINAWHLSGNDERQAKNMLFSLESHSAHPLARSVVRELEGARLQVLTDIQEEKGIGIHASDEEGNRWYAGSYRLLGSSVNGGSHDIYLLRNNELFAAVDLEDAIKPEAPEVIRYFRKQGLIPVLISGDRKDKCESFARKLDIQEVYSEKLPAEKLELIAELNKKGGVAMVGDGVNDAPALSKANVGISLSNATQVAIQSAQVILLKGNLKLLTKAFSISKVTMTIIKQNLFWAFFYNVLAIPIAAVGLLDPMIAAASMAVSDVVVVLNSLRLRSKKLD